MEHSIQDRIEGALWGLFVADSLAMPIHWYYNRKNITSDFPGGVTQFEAPRHPHPEAFMIGMRYRPDVETAQKLGRPYDILHDHARFYDSTYSDMGFSLRDQEGSHGNAVAAAGERYHYHHGLNAGDNTVAAHLVRVLMRQIADAGRYDPVRFVNAMVSFLTTPGLNRDPYTEIYLRRWFENYSRGADPLSAAEHQRNVWSIGSHGGMIRPMVLSMLIPNDTALATGVALDHQVITHRSEIVSGALSVSVPLLHDLIRGMEIREAVASSAPRIRMPSLNGRELFAEYRNNDGPGNISKDRMWHIHMDRSEARFDPASLAEDPGTDQVVMGAFATACYPEHGLPLAMFHAWNNTERPFEALIADANAGGDNVHRGMVLGLLVGAADPKAMRKRGKDLCDADDIHGEIAAFAEHCVSDSAY